MDHQHQQWRRPGPPPIPGTPCPNCSISHFPFCPPPPSFHQNPIFPGNSFQRPGLDPYSRPVGAPAPIPRPTWHTNPNFHGFAPPPYGGNVFVSEGDRSFKRPRIDGFGPGSFSDDERRLKLIHDHGGASSDQVSNSEISRDNKNSNSSFVHNQVGNNDRHYAHNNNVNESHHSYMKPHYYNNNNNNTTTHGNQLPQPYGQPSHGAHRPVFRPLPIGGQPPLPASPPPPLPAYQLHPEAHHSLGQPYYHSKPFSHASTGYVMEESRVFQQTFSKPYVGEGQQFPRKHLDEPKIIDASDLFKQPLRAIRPDHFVVILRGLPGSGKSYLAKMLRDLEVENGGRGPRIHSMDDYFMTEVEKVEEIDASKSSSSSRSKKPLMKKVMEYCYEPEMEEAYRMSMLKAFKKTLEDGDFTFVIVDDRNLRVAEFAQFWATAKSSGYEVYILEAPYKDPAGCAARNVHGFTQDDIQKMAGQWEESPSIYLQLDAKSLFHGDDLKESGIQEVDMDTEDTDTDGISGLQETKPVKTLEPPAEDEAPDGSSKNVKSLDAEEDHPSVIMKELGRSKWSEILDDGDTDKSEVVKGNNNALSGLIQAYHKEAKSVCWSDQVRDTGFSITAAKKAKASSLVIGPGAGYNLLSNPLPEEENPAVTRSSAKSKRQNVFQDQLRAEHESFKAVFDRRRHRIGGLGLEDE